MNIDEIGIVIPSLDPDEKFVRVVEGMIAAGFKKLILVDDGSDAEHKRPFEKAMEHPECTLLVHEVNRGKGQALKTAFAHALSEMPELKAVITIDGDGQHTPEDAMKLAEGQIREPEKVMMGCRDFSLSNVPTHNKLGNRLTSLVFLVLCGIRLSDTQTGLRSIPSRYLREFCEEVEGSRFEYETNMLLYMHDAGIEFTEIPIETLYIEENKSSHFNPLRDSYRIYKLILGHSTLFKQGISSVICKVVDLVLFRIFDAMIEGTGNVWSEVFLSTLLARIPTAFLNYYINRRWVFRSNAKVSSSMAQYFTLSVIQMLLSWLGTAKLVELAGASGAGRTWLKLLVDAVLFFGSYAIQKRYIFKK